MNVNKQAYLSPINGTLEITVIRDARPHVVIALDLGIPNFTVFSLQIPLVEDKPNSMSELIGEAVHILLDEVSAFMLSLKFEEKIIVAMYASVLTCFKSITGEADTSKSQSAISKDPTVKTFEGTFKLPQEFVNETQARVVTASSGKPIKRPPTHRHLELTYQKPSKTTVNDARKVIRDFRSRSLKTQPRPMYIIVYDQLGRPQGTIPVGNNFKNNLLNTIYPKKANKNEIEFSPTIKFDNDIEMMTTNAEGIPKSIFIGNEQYSPIATISDDMALYLCKESKDGKYVVKFPDGRCVAFSEFPAIEYLKDNNYPVPDTYIWTMLPKDEVPESSDENEAVDERGTEVIEGTERETDPVTHLMPDDEKNRQLEEWKTSSSNEDIDALLDPLTNMWGKLSPDIRKRLTAVIKNPNEKTWNNAYSIILNRKSWVTLWQAVIAVDPSFPRIGPASGLKGRRIESWKKIPDRETLIEALRYANPVKHDKTPTTDYDKKFMKSLGITSARKKKAYRKDDKGYWVGDGGGASGVLPICTSTGRICLAWRSPYVQRGDCWGTIGGAIQEGMSPSDSAREELAEETGYSGSIRLIPSYVFIDGTFKYYNFIGLVPNEFDLHPMDGESNNTKFTDETDAIAWFTWEDLQKDIKVNSSDYHPGVLKLIQQSGDQIREICEVSSNRVLGD